MEADHQASTSGAGINMPIWLRRAEIGFLILYTFEMLVRLFVERIRFFSSSWNLFDGIVVLFGLIGEIVGNGMSTVSVLRTVRLLRLLRVVRLLTAFQELWCLIRGLMECLRTLMWSFILLLVTLTIWSIFAVEMINPLMPDIEASGAYQTCNWCGNAFSSVMHANLTFFQIISGDGWSTLGRPLIEAHPWTVVVFLGVIFTLMFGLLNLVTAVMVDSAAKGRQADMAFLAQEKEAQKRRAKVVLKNLCRKLDLDSSGHLTLSELQTACQTSTEFKNLIKILDIGMEEMECVFHILDSDHSGDVSYEEFSEQIWKMKSQESKTLLMFIKYYVLQIFDNTKAEIKTLHEDVTETLNRTISRNNSMSMSNLTAGMEAMEKTMEERLEESQRHFTSAMESHLSKFFAPPATGTPKKSPRQRFYANTRQRMPVSRSWSSVSAGGISEEHESLGDQGVEFQEASRGRRMIEEDEIEGVFGKVFSDPCPEVQTQHPEVEPQEHKKHKTKVTITSDMQKHTEKSQQDTLLAC
eukprot:gnl/MRDRNA2_/MRDRNA2_85522_c0_seq1.p1 gnl/MRDRNA2_/MRDRNA2_85522_c0~~gnl/MRDRNA2_/MRDRNA2_85522_c0_seq1.p1  ORF type:complete len:552 (+),score=84.86 gnl/MRDRNA2_/MRDRNA2_85522_c0_seq1:84-1658(+)